MPKSWRSGSPVSMPVPTDPDKNPIITDFGGGFGMTMYGIAHVISQQEYEEAVSPQQGPLIVENDFLRNAPVPAQLPSSLDPSVGNANPRNADPTQG